MSRKAGDILKAKGYLSGYRERSLKEEVFGFDSNRHKRPPIHSEIRDGNLMKGDVVARGDDERRLQGHGCVIACLRFVAFGHRLGRYAAFT